MGPAGDGLDAVDEQLIARLAGRAREGGLALTGENGLLAQLTKRLVELHGGAFQMESEPGVGTTVSFTLPLETVEAAAEPQAA